MSDSRKTLRKRERQRGGETDRQTEQLEVMCWTVRDVGKLMMAGLRHFVSCWRRQLIYTQIDHDDQDVNSVISSNEHRLHITQRSYLTQSTAAVQLTTARWLECMAYSHWKTRMKRKTKGKNTQLDSLRWFSRRRSPTSHCSGCATRGGSYDPQIRTRPRFL